MRKFTAVVASFVVLAIPTVTQGEGEPTPAPQQPTTLEHKMLRNGCKQLYTQHQFRHYARRVYQRRTLTKRAGHQVHTMVLCQHSPRAERKMRIIRHRMQAGRKLRLMMGCGSPACNRRLAFYLGSRRYGSAGANCLVWIGDSEGSGWITTTYNTAGSGAYGIPQALPGSKMASHGSDWQTSARTQIRWMMDYVDSTYGGPCSAQGHWQAARSY